MEQVEPESDGEVKKNLRCNSLRLNYRENVNTRSRVYCNICRCKLHCTWLLLQTNSTTIIAIIVTFIFIFIFTFKIIFTFHTQSLLSTYSHAPSPIRSRMLSHPIRQPCHLNSNHEYCINNTFKCELFKVYFSHNLSPGEHRCKLTRRAPGTIQWRIHLAILWIK